MPLKSTNQLSSARGMANGIYQPVAVTANPVIKPMLKSNSAASVRLENSSSKLALRDANHALLTAKHPITGSPSVDATRPFIALEKTLRTCPALVSIFFFLVIPFFTFPFHEGKLIIIITPIIL